MKKPPYAKASEDKPKKMIELYQYEECPYCKKVRTKFTDSNPIQGNLSTLEVLRPSPK